MRRRSIGVFAAALALPAAGGAIAGQGEPIIDMHVHTLVNERSTPEFACPNDQPITYPALDPAIPAATDSLIGCSRPIASVTSKDELRIGTIKELRRAGVVRAVLMGSSAEVERWERDAPGMFMPADVPADSSNDALLRLRKIAETGQVKILAELGTQYLGIRADDPRLDEFWKLAEQMDIPVGIHLGEGMPMVGASTKAERYRASLTTPFQLEAVLQRYPKLRLYVMHAASPLTDEMIAMLFTYPTLYVDISANDWNMPRPQFYDQLKRLVDAGFSKRIMFGSDQTIFPQAIGIAVKTIDEAPFLTAEQKRDIFYYNAARFLRLSKEQIERDHRR